MGHPPADPLPHAPTQSRSLELHEADREDMPRPVAGVFSYDKGRVLATFVDRGLRILTFSEEA